MGQVEVEVYQNHKELLDSDLALSIREEDGHLYIDAVFDDSGLALSATSATQSSILTKASSTQKAPFLR